MKMNIVNNNKKLKLSFDVVRPIKSFSKTLYNGITFKASKDTLYPVVGTNNGVHVMLEDDGGEPVDYVLWTTTSDDDVATLYDDDDNLFQYYDINSLLVAKSGVFPKDSYACDTSLSMDDNDDLSWCSAEVFNSLATFGYKAIVERYNEAGFIDMTQIKRTEEQMCAILAQTNYVEGIKAYMSMLKFIDEHKDVHRCNSISEMIEEIGKKNE